MAEYLTQKEQEFVEQGYTIFRGLFSGAEIAKISEMTNNLIEMINEIDYPHDGEIHKMNYHGSQFVLQDNGVNSTTIHRIVWAAGAMPGLLEYSRSYKLTSIVAKLLQTSHVDHLINSIHPKLSHDGVEFKIHQDEIHRRTFDANWVNVNEDRTYVVCVTAVDPMSSQNGGIYVLPSSHRVRRLLSAEEISEVDVSQAIAPSLEPGDTMCMHQHLLHYSLTNHCNESSRIIYINGWSVQGANHEPYPGEGSAQPIDIRPEDDFLL